MENRVPDAAVVVDGIDVAKRIIACIDAENAFDDEGYMTIEKRKVARVSDRMLTIFNTAFGVCVAGGKGKELTREEMELVTIALMRERVPAEYAFPEDPLLGKPAIHIRLKTTRVLASWDDDL